MLSILNTDIGSRETAGAPKKQNGDERENMVDTTTTQVDWENQRRLQFKSYDFQKKVLTSISERLLRF